MYADDEEIAFLRRNRRACREELQRRLTKAFYILMGAAFVLYLVSPDIPDPPSFNLLFQKDDTASQPIDSTQPPSPPVAAPVARAPEVAASILPQQVPQSLVTVGRLAPPPLREPANDYTVTPDGRVTSVKYLYRIILTNPRQSCREVKFPTYPLPVTALASVPGAGNTWARHLIQLITGFHTGSVYEANEFKDAFPAEGIANSSVVAFKTHRFKLHFLETGFHQTSEAVKLGTQRVVLVLRHPREAAKAEYQREMMESHTEQYKGKIEPAVWSAYYEQRPLKWKYFYWYWLSLAYTKHLDVFILNYDDLLSNLPRALVNLAYFLGVHLSQDDIKCIVENSEGKFHRKKVANLDNFNIADNYMAITNGAISFVDELVKECRTEGWCATSGSERLPFRTV